MLISCEYFYFALGQGKISHSEKFNQYKRDSFMPVKYDLLVSSYEKNILVPVVAFRSFWEGVYLHELELKDFLIVNE